jgi:DNA-binding NarL/FixJ family response regulator
VLNTVKGERTVEGSTDRRRDGAHPALSMPHGGSDGPRLEMLGAARAPLSAPAPWSLLVAVVAPPNLRARMGALLVADGATLVASADTVEGLADACAPRVPHVTVLDWEAGGPEAVRFALDALPRTRLVVVMRRDRSPDVRAALRAGADGVLPRRRLALSLAVVVRSVSAGQASVPRERRLDLRQHSLSRREYDVLALASEGLRNAEIASRLCLAESTIKRHLTSIYAKLGAQSRDDLLGRVDEQEETDPTAGNAKTRFRGRST